ncbi:hypothetical protein QFC21_003718 [Naganishia friedmannii]|uniref:Uncharacterized protein n=1 Tax=Naganishia friedmannii TaxID=89922 RepID=A0ACC2VMQ2_9TREE|nr:hypothetical protein QFC21_003718 [Naganishia friedmannii]
MSADLLAPPPSLATPVPPPLPVGMRLQPVLRAHTRAIEVREVNVVDDILRSEADENIPPDTAIDNVTDGSKKRSNNVVPSVNRSGVKRLRKAEEVKKNTLRGTDITKEQKQGGVKLLPKDKEVVQLAISRKGGGASWTPIPYEEAIQLQKTWREHRWCMDKICNEYIGDRLLARSSGAAATTILECREKVLHSFTALVEPYLIATSQVRNGKFTGAMLAYSMVDAIIGVTDAEKLKEVIARVTTQVHERPDSSW